MREKVVTKYLRLNRTGKYNNKAMLQITRKSSSNIQSAQSHNNLHKFLTTVFSWLLKKASAVIVNFHLQFLIFSIFFEGPDFSKPSWIYFKGLSFHFPRKCPTLKIWSTDQDFNGQHTVLRYRHFLNFSTSMLLIHEFLICDSRHIFFVLMNLVNFFLTRC